MLIGAELLFVFPLGFLVLGSEADERNAPARQPTVRVRQCFARRIKTPHCELKFLLQKSEMQPRFSR